MQGTILKRALALLAVLLMLNGTVAVASAQIGGGGKETPVVEEEETTGGSGPCWTRNADDVIDPDEAGLTGRRSYESPLFGYTVDWGRGWVLDEYFDTPVISFPGDDRDALCLWHDDDVDFGYLYVVGQSATRGGPDADLDEWTDPDYIENQWTTLDVEVLLADASRDRAEVIYLMFDPENDITYVNVYFSLEMSDGSMLYITFVTDIESAEATYPSVADRLLIDGEPVLTLFTWEDIDAEL